MIKRYKGRVVVPGDVIAEALVTHTGFNTLIRWQILRPRAHSLIPGEFFRT